MNVKIVRGIAPILQIVFDNAGNIISKLHSKFKSRFESDDERTISRRNITLSNYSNGVAGNLVGTNFFTGFLLLLKANDALIGLITIISLAGNLLQIFSPLILERFPKRKNILIAGRCIIHFINILILGIIPFIGLSTRGKLISIMTSVLLINLVNAAVAPGYAVWHIKSIPGNIRTKYFSFFSITNGIIVYALILGASRLVDFFKVNGNELKGLELLRVIALLFAIIDIYFLTKVVEYQNKQDSSQINIKSVLIKPFMEKKYLITVCIACLWSLTANIPGPYFNVYMLKDLKVSYSYLNIINLLNIPILILLTPVWAKKIQKSSNFRTLYFSMGLYLISYIGLSFTSSKALILYPLFTAWAFIIAPGINLAFSSIPYINVPETNQTNYIGFYSTMNNLAALIGVAAGRQFIELTGDLRLKICGITLQNKQYILLLTALLMLVAVVIINILQKKESNYDGLKTELDAGSKL